MLRISVGGHVLTVTNTCAKCGCRFRELPAQLSNYLHLPCDNTPLFTLVTQITNVHEKNLIYIITERDDNVLNITYNKS